MKITILSGGSGNEAIMKGIMALYPECDLKVITNAYDNGKSTGVCRYVTDTLGVSDIRKNHFRMYKIKHTPKQEFINFWENRYDLPKGKEKESVISMLSKWNLNDNIIVEAVNEFFANPKSQEFEYKSFNIANIVYSAMYKKLGYEETNKYFCDLLEIDDFVLLNSFDNVFISARTEDGKIIEDEGDIVEYKGLDKIREIIFTGDVKGEPNWRAIDRILESDLIIHSTGTFWSSIYPTMAYADLYKVVNVSKARKLWVMNTAEDKDSYGVTSENFINYYKELGLKIEDWCIIQNSEACEGLKSYEEAITLALGNENGKNNPQLVGEAIFRCYYNLFGKYDKVILDFDDTIVDRDYAYREASCSNLEHLKNNEYIVISGNSFESIKRNIERSGYRVNELKTEIWADVNSILYVNGEKVRTIKCNIIKNLDKAINIVLKYVPSIYSVTETNIKLKPIQDRDSLIKKLNGAFRHEELMVKAIKAGRTTIDIITSSNEKSIVYYEESLSKLRTLYIGDEVFWGNDSSIANMCTQAIQVNNPRETNIILGLL